MITPMGPGIAPEQARCDDKERMTNEMTKSVRPGGLFPTRSSFTFFGIACGTFGSEICRLHFAVPGASLFARTFFASSPGVEVVEGRLVAADPIIGWFRRSRSVGGCVRVLARDQEIEEDTVACR
jgi:hypothetical protein